MVTGSADPHIGADEVAGWNAECVQPPAVRRVPGGHFYFEDDPSLITDLLRDVIRTDQHVEFS